MAAALLLPSKSLHTSVFAYSDYEITEKGIVGNEDPAWVKWWNKAPTMGFGIYFWAPIKKVYFTSCGVILALVLPLVLCDLGRVT